MHRILYLSYWGFSDGLTKGSVSPNIRILGGLPNVDKVTLVTIERKRPWLKVDQEQLIQIASGESIVHKVVDIFNIPRLLKKIIVKENISFVIARSSLAGMLAMKSLHDLDLKLLVESFEPHADYMIEAGEWGRFPKYYLQKRWESQILKKASAVSVLTRKYKNQLLEERQIDSEKLDISPCFADPVTFRYSESDRYKIREELGISSGDTVAIYVGKFGGLYIDFPSEMFANWIDSVNTNKLIILSSEDLSSKLSKEGMIIKSVPHEEVPRYLSAADFALSLQKPLASLKAMSPIKTAEYAVNGLPVVFSANVGDDTKRLININKGMLLKSDSLVSVNEWYRTTADCSREDYTDYSYRGPDVQKEVYQKVLA